MKNIDVLVIGAGALGVSVAYHLAKAGRQVVVLEKEASYAHHSSGKNAGMIRQLYRHPQLTEWTKRSIAGWPEEVKSRAFQQTGSLIVGRKLPEHHTELFEQRQVSVCFDGHTSELPAVYCATDGLLDPGDHVSALYQCTDKQFVSYHFKTEVKGLEKTGELWKVEAQQCGDTLTFETPWVVNAAGAWLNDFLDKHEELKVDAEPFARHLFVMDGWEQDYMPEPDVGFYWEEERRWYMRLWEQKKRLISICDMVAACPETFVPDPHIQERVATQLLSALPEQAEQLQLGQFWHCFRTYTDDLLPIWGEDSRQKGLFWLAAFGGFGMSTSFAAAEDAASYMCGKDPGITEQFLPGRVRS